MTQYCDQCTFCQVPNNGLLYARCGHQAANQISNDRFVSKTFDVPPYASSMRGDVNSCGPEAKWFEAKIAEAAE